MRILAACVLGFVLDLILGDPVWLYHPVRIIGNLIAVFEKKLREIFGNSKKGNLIAGGVLCVLIITFSTGIPLAILYLAHKIHPILSFLLESFWCYQLLATKSLRVESMRVAQRLYAGDLAGARVAVSMIVGRDTESLNEAGVTKAAVETVAENTSDGVIAPLIFMMIGGAPLGFFYKAINTMDSMVGYTNEKYLYFGRAAAKLDDIMNFIPARISALLMIVAAFLSRMDGKNAYRIYRRDRMKHASPNSAQTEAVCAGALDVQLAGDAYYFGTLHPKKTIGDDIRPVETEDISRTCRLMDVTAWIAVVMLGLLRFFAVTVLSHMI
ncbi:MAG: adenosylcobinamide-phosphate synthase CbiB [Hespellia sp.]|nr:adenosylcobinamide-phosphate synthase CbiB [Hespellia sp.]